MIGVIDGVVYDTDKMYEICAWYPPYGRGTYSVLYRTDSRCSGQFLIEEGICDQDKGEEEVLDFKLYTVEEAKKYFKLFASDYYDEEDLQGIWYEIFGD